MSRSDDTSWEDCLEQILKLPPKWQRTFAWFINNIEFAVRICEETELKETELADLKQKAIETDDTVLEFLLLLYDVLKYKKAPSDEGAGSHSETEGEKKLQNFTF